MQQLEEYKRKLNYKTKQCTRFNCKDAKTCGYYHGTKDPKRTHKQNYDDYQEAKKKAKGAKTNIVVNKNLQSTKIVDKPKEVETVREARPVKPVGEIPVIEFSEESLEAIINTRHEAQSLIERDPHNVNLNEIVYLLDDLHNKMSNLKYG